MATSDNDITAHHFFAQPFRPQFYSRPVDLRLRGPVGWRCSTTVCRPSVFQPHQRLLQGKLLFCVRRSVPKEHEYITRSRRGQSKSIRPLWIGWNAILVIPPASFSIERCSPEASNFWVSRYCSIYRRCAKWHGNAPPPRSATGGI
jgi:hypothetical protein